MITRKAGPALAAGCAMVLKPAPQTPFSALALAALAERAGIPAGLFSVITADAAMSREVGAELCEHPVVRKLSFTGSTAVGIKLMQQCAPTLKKLSLELGGNAPFIVFDDADLDAAVEGAMISKYRNAGQTCVCANRIYVQDGIYDAFVDKFSAAVARLKVGNGAEEGVTTGPLIDAAAVPRFSAICRTPSPRVPPCWPVANPMPWVATSSSRRWWAASLPRWPWRARKPSARWRRCSASAMKPR